MDLHYDIQPNKEGTSTPEIRRTEMSAVELLDPRTTLNFLLMRHFSTTHFGGRFLNTEEAEQEAAQTTGQIELLSDVPIYDSPCPVLMTATGQGIRHRESGHMLSRHLRQRNIALPFNPVCDSALNEITSTLTDRGLVSRTDMRLYALYQLLISQRALFGSLEYTRGKPEGQKSSPPLLILISSGNLIGTFIQDIIEGTNPAAGETTFYPVSEGDGVLISFIQGPSRLQIIFPVIGQLRDQDDHPHRLLLTGVKAGLTSLE